MTYREPVPRFLAGDNVEKGEETGRIVQLTSRAGKPFLMVWIWSGLRKGQREYPERGWHALIDWSTTGELRKPCAECERPFKQPVDGTVKTWCRTCQRREDAVDEQKTTWAGPSHQFGRRPR